MAAKKDKGRILEIEVVEGGKFATKEARDQYEVVAARTLSFEEQVIAEVYHRMPWGQKFEIYDANGKPMLAEITPSITPNEDVQRHKDGTMFFGFNVQWDSGHISFRTKVAGWGGIVLELVTLTDKPEK